MYEICYIVIGQCLYNNLKTEFLHEFEMVFDHDKDRVYIHLDQSENNFNLKNCLPVLLVCTLQI